MVDTLEFARTQVEVNKGKPREAMWREIVGALELKEQCEWHDLRKNPHDLPTKNGLKVVVDFAGDYGTAFYFQDRRWWEALYPAVGKPIAWKEIEPIDWSNDNDL